MSRRMSPAEKDAPPVARGTRPPRRGAARRRDPGGRLARLGGNLVFPLLALAALGVLAGIASCVASALPVPELSAVSGGSASPAPADAWIPLRSQEPADILAAARGGALYREAQAGGDGARDLSRLGAPVLVLALHPAGASATAADQAPDFYVVPVLNAAGAVTDAIELALNPTRSAAREIAIITYSAPRASGSVAQLSSDQARKLVTSQRHVAPQAGVQPYLIYFALAAQSPTSQSDQPGWGGGGALPADPIWLVPTAHGESYLAGDDSVVYTIAELPQATTP